MSYNLSFGDVRAHYGQDAIDGLLAICPGALLPEWRFEEASVEGADPVLVAWSPTGLPYVLSPSLPPRHGMPRMWAGPFVGGPL